MGVTIPFVLILEEGFGLQGNTCESPFLYVELNFVPSAEYVQHTLLSELPNTFGLTFMHCGRSSTLYSMLVIPLLLSVSILPLASYVYSVSSLAASRKCMAPLQLGLSSAASSIFTTWLPSQLQVRSSMIPQSPLSSNYSQITL